MNKKQSKNTLNKNFFKEMNYELAGEIGVIYNEDMVDNKKLNPKKHKKRHK